jgi:hypothetical protein
MHSDIVISKLLARGEDVFRFDVDRFTKGEATITFSPSIDGDKCVVSNRYLWLTIDSGGDAIKERRDQMIRRSGEQICKETCAKLEELMASGRVISHNEVRDEIRNARSTAWNRWILKNRKAFKGGANDELAKILNKIAEQDSDFLAEEKPGRAKHADPWILAQAIHFKLTIIAEDAGFKKIANKYNVTVIGIFDLLKNEKSVRPGLFD